MFLAATVRMCRPCVKRSAKFAVRCSVTKTKSPTGEVKSEMNPLPRYWLGQCILLAFSTLPAYRDANNNTKRHRKSLSSMGCEHVDVRPESVDPK